MTSTTSIPDDRELTAKERRLVEWLLDHSSAESNRYRSQLGDARVAARCSCGCASVDFAIGGVMPKRGGPMSILSDYEWIDSHGRIFGVFVFARCDLLAGLEVWSQDGMAIANYLPDVTNLRPIGSTDTGEPSNAPESRSRAF
ncbi:hypothetical protein N9Z53_01990 [Mariniblastus sp.]|nr:hypothetical protein [Mariniblastus sp.]MDB4372524.1 hypothetical protein [Mariniblastus sp.]MDB4380744.1 hypothetical protein [Mariniblastus sp.]